MQEKQKHLDAYAFYRDMPKRNLREVGRRLGVSGTSITNWSTEFNWQERVLLFDQEVHKGVQEKALPDAINLKAYLLKVQLEQIKLGREAGVIPTTSREMTAGIKEARSIMGEDTDIDNKVTIYVKYDG